MLKRLRLRIQDIRTISKLNLGAEEQAHNNGEDEPGAEHFLLSALNLPDGTARRVFERIGANPDYFQAAITKQYDDALSSVGVDRISMDNEFEPVTTDRIFYYSKPSGQTVMKKLYALKKHDKDKPLLGAHIVEVIAGMKYGVVARALNVMDIDRNDLRVAVKDELNSLPD